MFGGEDGDNEAPVFHRIVVPISERKLGPKPVETLRNSGEATRRNLTIGDLQALALNKVEKLAGMNWVDRLKAFFWLVTISEDIEEKKLENPFS